MPIPDPLPGRNVVQFVNESPATVLLAAFGPSAVEPREKTWTLAPGQYLTIDIPTGLAEHHGEGLRGTALLGAHRVCLRRDGEHRAVRDR